MRILFLYESSQTYTNTVFEHLDCFRLFSSAETYFVHADAHRVCPVNLAIFDCVVIHYSIRVGYNCLSESFVNAVAAHKGLKVLFIQDEYEYTERARCWIERLGINVLFTCVPEKHRELIYPSRRFPGVTFFSNLTGYVPLTLEQLPKPLAMSKRSVVIGYRGRPLPYWLGMLAQEKVWIGQRMRAICQARGVPVDIEWEENQRIYGHKWYDFLRRCRATLGTESGSNVFDDEGLIRDQVKAALTSNPSLSFNEIYHRYVRPHESAGLMNQISPRIFESVALHTTLVLFEGKYSGILEPEKHFIPLKKDFSNIDEVLTTLQNLSYLEELTERAYCEIVEPGHYSYKHFVEMVDGVLREEYARKVHNGLGRDNDRELYRALEHGAITTAPVRAFIDGASAEPWSLREALRNGVRSMLRRTREHTSSEAPLMVSRRMLDTQLNFYKGHGIECAFDNRGDTYVAARDGQPIPQKFSVHLRQSSLIVRVVVQWHSSKNLGQAYDLRLRVGDRITWEKRLSHNNLKLTPFETLGAEADCIELCVHQFLGQQRLLLRNVQIFSKNG